MLDLELAILGGLVRIFLKSLTLIQGSRQEDSHTKYSKGGGKKKTKLIFSVNTISQSSAPLPNTSFSFFSS